MRDTIRLALVHWLVPIPRALRLIHRNAKRIEGLRNVLFLWLSIRDRNTCTEAKRLTLLVLEELVEVNRAAGVACWLEWWVLVLVLRTHVGVVLRHGKAEEVLAHFGVVV